MVLLAIIIGALAIIGTIIAIVCSVSRTPSHLRGYYGSMFWTIASIALVGVIALGVILVLI